MIIGVPKEIKNHEYRVGMIPATARALTGRGHTVLVEAGAGLGSGIPDEEYADAGATLIDSCERVWGESEMIVKVKEPVAPEYDRIQPDQTIYTYFHLAAEPALAKVLLEKRVAAVAYETIQLPDGSLPLLKPMSEVAGRMAAQVGATCLQKEHGGKGMLLGGVPGVKRGRVLVIGGGIVGLNAAKIAVGMGARVTILDVNPQRLAWLDDVFMGRAETLYSDTDNIAGMLPQVDLIIGAVLLAGARAPLLVKRSQLKTMEPGSVIVDVAVDQGGCIETARPTTHENPTYVIDDIVHYCVANMPGAVARTSTFALNNTTRKYCIALAEQGVAMACANDAALRLGLNTYKGDCTYAAVARDLGYEYVEPKLG